jgi:hypothetical protein
MPELCFRYSMGNYSRLPNRSSLHFPSSPNNLNSSHHNFFCPASTTSHDVLDSSTSSSFDFQL